MPTHSSSTSPSLLARARAKDPQAWRELVELYAPLVGHWSRRCGIPSQDLADCLQEVFSSVARAIDSFEPRNTSGAFRGWLWTITRNKVRDLARQRMRQPHAPGGSSARQALNGIPDPNSIPDDEPTDAVQLDHLIRRGLDSVREEFEAQTWRAFWRTTVDGIATALVAKELGVTPATVRQSRSRVLRRLRQQLGDLD